MQKLSFITICLGLLIGSNPIHAQKEDGLNSYTRNEKIIHMADEFEGVELRNQHGDISVTGWLKDTILVEIEILVKAEYQEMADEVLDRININKTKLNNLAYFRTGFEEEFHPIYPFRINYNIFMPSDKQLIIDNRFGDINISDVTGKLELKSEYGNITQLGMQQIDTVITNLWFGEAEFQNIGFAKMELYNNNVKIVGIENGDFSGQYCQTDIKKAGKVHFSTRTARINVGQVKEVDINGHFCFVSIDEISRRGKIEISNGLLITHLSKKIQELEVFNKNAPANITLASGIAYTLHGEVTNGQFRHDQQENFKIINDHNKIFFSGEYNANGETAEFVLFNQNAGINIKSKK